MAVSAPTTSDDRLRVVVQQPALPAYRIPVFRALAARPGIDLSVYYAADTHIDNVEADGFRAERTPQPRELPGGMSWSGAQWRLAGTKPDVLVLEWNVRRLSLIPSILRARLGGARVVVWGHGYSKREAGWKAALRRFAARRAHAALFYNHTVANRHIEKHGFDPRRTYVALNSLDQAPIREASEARAADPASVQELRDEHGLHGPVILYVSRLLEENRADLLFDALARLGDRVPGAAVVIIGAGPDQERLRAEARTKGVADRVRFIGKLYGEDKLSGYFALADVFCYPINIGLAMMHAMGYGVPVVTSDNPTNHGPEIEALIEGENGLLFKEGDAADLARKLAQVLGDPDFRERLSRGALETVRERFSVERMVDGYEAAVLGAEPPASRSR